jgi:hypothetical protein
VNIISRTTGTFTDITDNDFFNKTVTRTDSFLVDLFSIGNKVQWSPNYLPNIEELRNAIQYLLTQQLE